MAEADLRTKAAIVIRQTWDAFGDVPFPLYDREINALVDALFDHSIIRADDSREALNRIQSVLAPADNARTVETVGRAREIALAALNQC